MNLQSFQHFFTGKLIFIIQWFSIRHFNDLIQIMLKLSLKTSLLFKKLLTKTCFYNKKIKQAYVS